MDKTAIKNFSIWARNKLIADITYKAGLLGITEEGIKDALPQSTQDAEFYDIGTKEPYAIHGEEIKQRKELVSAIRKKASQLEYKEAYRNVIEEVAYTWFNRLIAIRFMEVNDYMPAHIRVLSSEGGKKLEPDLVTTPFDAEIEFTQQETENILQMKNDNQVDALFRFLFIKQCNALNAYLPKLFEKTSDYTELLLNVSVTDQDGIVYHLTHDIKEDDFNISNIGEDGKPTGQVEIIGWMYQYYNTEPKDEAFALLKSNVKITKERIPAATQLFTPDWIVRYMVENSVGRLWLEGHENKELKKGWKYYLDEAEQEADVEEQLKAIREEYKNIKPEEIKVIDPCMGSGHILVYAFDVLMQIYESYGYSQREAAKSIVENNIYGLDIDDRAFQLAYFAIMMKARSYNRRFLTLGIEPNLCAIQESNGIQYDKEMGDFLLSEEHRETLQYLLHIFVDAKEYGSILNVEKRDYDGFLEAWKLTAEASLGNVVMMLWYNECNQVVPVLAKQAKILSQKYECVITNPPYMGISNGNAKLNEFVKAYYFDCKADLYAVFMYKCRDMLEEHGYMGMIAQQSWMFLSSFEKMRSNFINTVSIVNLLHLGARAFEEISGEVVQTASYIARKMKPEKYIGKYYRLVDYGSQKEKEIKLLEHNNEYEAQQRAFLKIPGTAIAYWCSDKFIDLFSEEYRFTKIAAAKAGLSTTDNNKYLRLWHEVNFTDIGFGYSNLEETTDCRYKYIPQPKGGTYRKWYGNLDYVVDWYNNGQHIRKAAEGASGGRIVGSEYYFLEGLTWSDITSNGMLSVRYMPNGMIFNSSAPSCFCKDNRYLYYVLAFMNTNIAKEYLRFLAPSYHFNAGAVEKLPVIVSDEYFERISELAKNNIEMAKNDWDSFEQSWDFKKHPFVKYHVKTMAEAYECWSTECTDRFNKTKENEEEINRLFAKIYNIENDVTCDLLDEEITIRKADIYRDITSFISYAVGCMFGRYSLTREGLCKGEIDLSDEEVAKDNILLITDEEYIDNDIVARFIAILRKVFGADTLEENLSFIAEHIDCKGNSSREILRNYFANDFYKNHCKDCTVAISGKRPMYWLFDSGKQNGFKALIYMHRYNADTIGNLRVDYLHRIERIYESEINRMQDTIDNSNIAREITSATKRKEKLQKQLKECKDFDEKIGHLALSRIKIDLDDGVKVNYEKVQTANDGKKYQVLAKI